MPKQRIIKVTMPATPTGTAKAQQLIQAIDRKYTFYHAPRVIYFQSRAAWLMARLQVEGVEATFEEIDPKHPLASEAGRRFVHGVIVSRYSENAMHLERCRVERVLKCKLRLDRKIRGLYVLAERLYEYVPFTVNWRAGCKPTIRGWGTLRKKHVNKAASARPSSTEENAAAA